MINSDIWKETITESFDEAGIQANEEQIDIVTGWVEGLHENWGTYTGSEYIPNPMCSEVDELKRKIRELERDKQCIVDGYCKNVATRRNVNPHDVTIDRYGNATYDLR